MYDAIFKSSLARQYCVAAGAMTMLGCGTPATGNVNIDNGPAYSSLPAERRLGIERRVAPPPISERDAPFATPMHYLLRRGYRDGYRVPRGSDIPDRPYFVLDRNRPDWQEVLMQDWAELGLTSTLFLTSPTHWTREFHVQQIHCYLDLSRKYGLEAAIRLGGDSSFGGISGGGWNLHPKNPENRIAEYVEWARRVAAEGKGKVAYYVVGDEINTNWWEQADGKGGTTVGHQAPEEYRWTPEIYLQVFKQISTAIKSEDPKAKVAMFGMAGMDWAYAEELVKLGFAEYGDAISANVIRPRDYQEIVDFARKVREAGFELYSNGVGYVGSKNAVPNPVNQKYNVYDDDEQAVLVARRMFKYFAAGWDRTPYYITLRQWEMPDGKVYPHWYGIFGFTTLVVDKDDNLAVRRHPAWYALQTVANIFYSRSKTLRADFEIEFSVPVDFKEVYTRNGYECLIVLWNDRETRDAGGGKWETENFQSRKTSITMPFAKYAYPVQISMSDYRQVKDLPYRIKDGKLTIGDIEIGREPVIIRLVAEDL